MSSPTPAVRGDLGFSYELAIDLDLGYGILPYEEDWQQIAFFTDAEPTNEKAFSDAATYADRGADRQTIVGEGWGLSFMHQLQRDPITGEFLEPLKTLLEKSKFGKRNDDSRVRVRFYDTEGADWAYVGVAYIAASRAQRGNRDIAGYTFTLTGDGGLTEITNPVSAAPPSIESVTPPDAVESTSVAIVGSGFNGVTQVATHVKFGATNATSFVVHSDELITAIMPAGAAGAANVVVVHPTKGASSAFPYTRGA